MPAVLAPPRRRRFPVVALVVTVVLALTLWGLAARQIMRTATASGAGTTTTATVVTCTDSPLGPGCTVRYTDTAGVVTNRPIDAPGLVGVVEGDVVPVHVTDDGRVTLGGWRPWLDALLLVGLAIGMTATGTRWLRTVLAESDRGALVHDADLTLLGEEPRHGRGEGRSDGRGEGLRDVG